MKLRRLAVLLLACFGLGGCPAYSLHPLYTEQDTVTEPALEGTWMGTDTDDKWEIAFRRSKNGSYEISVFDPDTKLKDTYDGNLVRLGGELFIDVQSEE